MRFLPLSYFRFLFKADTQFLSELIPAHFHRSPSATNLIGKDVYRRTPRVSWLLSRSLN
jgi:hypothetical protein